MRKEYLKEEKIETVYFGGGTPSQLGEEDFQQIFKAIQKHYGLEDCREITLEANPDDLSKEYLQMLSALPFNRIIYMVNAFRYGFLGISDVPLGTAYLIIIGFILVLYGMAWWLISRGTGLRH
jgi:coproporphyrinogen III oxidase-like Fe-S oxidoreductase